jgi:predicted outer membrane repeat protein
MRVRGSARAVVLLACMTLAAPLASHGASFTVDDDGEASDADTGDPACATAGGVCTLRAALEQANASVGPHTITLPAGTYVQSATLPAVVQDVTIAGPVAATTVVRASDVGRPRLLEVPAGVTLTLSGVALENAAVAPGSAILATGGDVVLDACVIQDCEGGAVLGESASPLGSPARITVTGTVFVGNTGGTALAVSDSYELDVSNSVFDQNHQTTTGLGGAIAIGGTGSGRTQVITGTSFSGNTAGGGGAVSVTAIAGTIAIGDSTFSGNGTGTLAGYGGAAILSFDPDLTITNTTFAGNLATGPSQNGGAILSPQIAFRCTGCTFNDNVATATGGAICATGMTILNSTFTANTAGTSGGAIYVDNPTLPNALALGNATVVGNMAAAGGGVRGGGTSVVVKNSIVAANTAPTGPDCVGAVGSQGYNVIGRDTGCTFTSAPGDQVGTGGAPIAPGVAALDFTGGPTATMALQPGSPAIDAGDPAGCTDFAAPPNPLATDQRGEARMTDGDGDGTVVCDAGAFEHAAVPVSSTTSTTGGPTTTGPTASSTSTTSSTTTSTTFPAPICADGVGMTKVTLTIRRIAAPAGDEALRFTGTLDLPAGRPAFFDPRTTGAQILIEDLGRGDTAVLELSHRTHPIPGGAGCEARDGWKKTRYVNASGRIDPPACTAGSANGLRTVRFKDRRRRGKGIAFLVATKGSNLGAPVGPFRGTIVLGASVVASAVGDCGAHAFATSACGTRRTTVRCR